jgi:16S rRNA (cytosine967-C5)-methyltransferase
MASRKAAAQAFEQLWEELFTTPVHLDSALSKRENPAKSILARIVPAILLRPVSQAEASGVGLAPGEPWSLAPDALARWRPAALLAERLHENLQAGGRRPEPVAEDFPPGMIEEWRADWGEDGMSALVGALGLEPPLSLRSARALGAPGLLSELTAGSRLPVSAIESPLSPCGVRLGGYAPVLGTEAFSRGAFEIQDEGSQVMTYFALWPERFAGLLARAPGPVIPPASAPALPEIGPAPTVVDACAGAGGKSLALADALGGKGRVFSYDTSARKLQALRRRATRAGLRNIQSVAVEKGKEREVVGRFRRRAQVVLVDAPCSGWGVLRRNPDIKWRQTPESLETMPELQGRILESYADLVAPGGRLVYGVCTFRKRETLGVVERFLGANPSFEAAEGGYLGPGPCDGFFMQAFRRNG